MTISVQPSLEAKLESLRDSLSSAGSILVAFSGGTDSSFLLANALKALGTGEVLAVTASSPIHPHDELEAAGRIALELGAVHLVIETRELFIERFVSNPPDRCYHCKLHLFEKLVSIARDRGIAAVMDGSNLDDLSDHRPGLLALKQLGIRSPLLEAGLGKEQIRTASRTMGLRTWDKPAMACLASRFPYGSRISLRGLRQVDRAECFLRSLGVGQVRVRHHGDTARIEVAERDIETVIERRLDIAERLKALGFAFTALDLRGYRPGSLNFGIPSSDH